MMCTHACMAAAHRLLLLRSADFHDVLSAAWHVVVVLVRAGAELCPTDRNPYSLVTQRYALGVADALPLAQKRQWIFFLRNKAFIIFRLLQVTWNYSAGAGAGARGGEGGSLLQLRCCSLTAVCKSLST